MAISMLVAARIQVLEIELGLVDGLGLGPLATM